MRFVLPESVTVPRDLAPLLEQSVLRPEATEAEVLQACRDAREMGLAAVCVRPGWVAAAAISVRESELVLEARIASAAHSPLSVLKRSCLRASFSGTASITRSTSCQGTPSIPAWTVTRSIRCGHPNAASPAASRAGSPARTLSKVSTTWVGQPARARVRAMSAPMVPPPTTAQVLRLFMRGFL